MHGTERRKYPRVQAHLVMGIRLSELRTAEALLRNVSLGGAFIETRSHFEPGDQVELTLELPGDTRQRLILAIVRWCWQVPPLGVGVEFIRANPSDLHALQEYIALQAAETVVLPEES